MISATMCAHPFPASTRLDRSESAYLHLRVDSGEAAVSNNQAAIEETLGHSVARDAIDTDGRAPVARAALGKEWPSTSHPEDGFRPRHQADSVGSCDPVQVNCVFRQVQDQVTGPHAHQGVMPFGGASSWTRAGCFNIDEGQQSCDGGGSLRHALLSPKRCRECSPLPNSFVEDECNHHGRELQCDVWLQGIPTMGEHATICLNPLVSSLLT